MRQSHAGTSSPTEAEDGVVLHQRPGVVVHAVALVDQQLTHVSRRHVGWNLHHFAGAILAPNLHDLKRHTAQMRMRTVELMFSTSRRKREKRKRKKINKTSVVHGVSRVAPRN